MLKARDGRRRAAEYGAADRIREKVLAQSFEVRGSRRGAFAVPLPQAGGRYGLLIGTSVEVTGDVFSGLTALLDDPTVGVVGRWGVVTRDIRSFDEAETAGDVDAVEGYLMAFRREILREIGPLDEKFRFYRHLDLDFSFAVRSRGYRAVVDTEL